MITETITFRPATEADIPRLVEIARAGSAERGVPPTQTEQDYRIWFSAPKFNAATDTQLAEVDGIVVASASASEADGQAQGGGYVLPAFRGRGIGSTLMRWVIERARGFDGATELMTWAAAENPGACALIESFGFSHVRSFHRMVNPSPASVAEPAFPAGCELRALDGAAAVDAAVAAWDGSFIDHFNFHPAQRDEWMHYVENDPNNDFTLWFFAYEGDALAGFCLNEIKTGSDGVKRGDLGPIGTMRSHRGIGLGRALLRHSVRALAARGCEEVELGVDSENPNGAVRLYASNGFAVTHEGRAYLLSL